MRIRRTRKLSAAEKQQLTGWGEDIYQSEALNLLWRPKEDHLVLYVGEEAVSHCGLIRQGIKVDNETLSIGGIGGVVTPPVYQGHGYARRVLKEAIAILTAEKHRAALLFCRRQLRPYYQSLGWRAVTAPVHILQPSGTRRFPACCLYYPLTDDPWPAGPVDIDGPPW